MQIIGGAEDDRGRRDEEGADNPSLPVPSVPVAWHTGLSNLGKEPKPLAQARIFGGLYAYSAPVRFPRDWPGLHTVVTKQDSPVQNLTPASRSCGDDNDDDDDKRRTPLLIAAATGKQHTRLELHVHSR